MEPCDTTQTRRNPRWRRGRAVAAVAGLAAGGYVALQVLGRGWGATTHERHRLLPGDDLVPTPVAETTHAITIAAPPAEVWPWLVQMGYHRGGWYTYEWVDRYLFRMSNPSADEVIPELQGIGVGDIIPDGEPGTAWYDIVAMEEARHLVLHSTTHLPPQWRENPRIGAWVDWSWVFVLEPIGPDATRLVVRVRGDCGPWWVRALFAGVIVPADFVMARSMLQGLARRVEAVHDSTAPRHDERVASPHPGEAAPSFAAAPS